MYIPEQHLQYALALVILRKRAAETAAAGVSSSSSVADSTELTYLRERARLTTGSQPDGSSLSLPPGADALIAWLEHRQLLQSDPAGVVRTGVALLDSLCLSTDGRCLGEDGGCDAVSAVLQRVLKAEGPTAKDSLGFAQRLCSAAFDSAPETTSTSWLGAVRALLVQVTAARGTPALDVLARKTLALVEAIKADSRLETMLIGAQPVLDAFQQALETAAATAEAWPVGEWRKLLQQAFELTDTLRLHSAPAPPLLAHCIWDLSLLASRVQHSAAGSASDVKHHGRRGLLSSNVTHLISA